MKVLLKIIFIFVLFPIKTYAFENPKVKINNFFIQKYEVTIAEFSNFAIKLILKQRLKNRDLAMNMALVGRKERIGITKLLTAKILIA